MSLLLTVEEQLKRASMFPHWKSLSLSVMIDCTLILSRCFLEVGARIRSSKWTNNHQ